MSEKKKYLFFIADFSEHDDQFNVQIMICPQDYWTETRTQSDWALTGELQDLGMLPDDFDEIAESAFCVVSQRTLVEVKQDLLARGFLEDPEYAAQLN